MNNIYIDCNDIVLLRGYKLDDIERMYSITQEPKVKSIYQIGMFQRSKE